jgi:hypothetical protein
VVRVPSLVWRHVWWWASVIAADQLRHVQPVPVTSVADTRSIIIIITHMFPADSLCKSNKSIQVSARTPPDRREATDITLSEARSGSLDTRLRAHAVRVYG